MQISWSEVKFFSGFSSLKLNEELNFLGVKIYLGDEITGNYICFKDNLTGKNFALVFSDNRKDN